MKKTYITTISLQPKGDLQKIMYEPSGFELKNNRATCFPIIPIIAETHADGDDLNILAVRMDNAGKPDNYNAFLEELKDMGIGDDKVTVISAAENQSDAMGVKLLLAILDKIPDESIIYADITFGTKPMSVMLMLAMNFVEKLKEVLVEGVFYGMLYGQNSVEGRESGGFLYDLTVYKHLGNFIDSISGMDVDDPQAILHKLTDL